MYMYMYMYIYIYIYMYIYMYIYKDIIIINYSLTSRRLIQYVAL